MGNLSLQKPETRRWPDFFGEPSKNRISIEKNSAVQGLVGCGLLLTKEFNFFIYKLLALTGEISELINTPVDINYKIDRGEVVEKVSAIIKEKKLDIKNTSDETFDTIFNDATEQVLDSKRKEIKIKILNLSDSMEDLLDKFKKINNLADLDIFEHKPLYYCKDCQRLSSKGSFMSNDCPCGKKIDSVVNTKKEDTVMLDGRACDFVRRDGYKTHLANFLR